MDKEHLYLGDALGNDVIRERRELLLQLMEQLHDSDVRAMALPHHGPPSSWQGLPVGARSLVTPVRLNMIRRMNQIRPRLTNLSVTLATDRFQFETEREMCMKMRIMHLVPANLISRRFVQFSSIERTRGVADKLEREREKQKFGKIVEIL